MLGVHPPEAAGDQNVWLAGGGELALAQVEHDTNFVFLTYTVHGSAP